MSPTRCARGDRFSVISDTSTDLVTEITRDESCDPDSLHSNMYNEVDNFPIILQDTKVLFTRIAHYMYHPLRMT